MGLDRIRLRNAELAPRQYPRSVRPALPLRSLPVLRSPCENEGAVLEKCYSCAGESRSVRECDVHGKCTYEFVSDKVMNCRKCRNENLGYKPDETTPEPTNPVEFKQFEWVSTAQLIKDSIRLAGLLPQNCVGVVGLPRSGLIPASVIASHLHLPLYELTHEGALNRLGHGSRGRHFGFKEGRGPLAVIDDTVYSGAAMVRARNSVNKLGREAVFAAVYSRMQVVPSSVGAVDLFARELPSPHLLEWNICNNGVLRGHAANPVYGKGVALDLDGVIVHDADSGGSPGTPFLVPRTLPVPLIATGRSERYRPQTEALLHRLGVKWDRLEMLPNGTPDTAQEIARHKAHHFKTSGCGFYVESDPLQAQLIHHHSGLPTICNRTGRVWAKGVTDSVPDSLLPLSSVNHIFKPLVGKRVALVHSPTTGNAGDRLIERATEQLLTRFGIEFEVTEPDRPGSADVIVLFGGGNVGHSLCPVEADRRARALATGLPCVLLPQTAYGPEPHGGYLTAFARDTHSQQFLPNSVLAPDLTLCYQPERPLPPPIHTKGEFFSRYGEGLFPNRGSDPRHQFSDPRDYLDFVATHAEIHTDSLHIAICGLIARRSVTLYPTGLHKQRSQYENWLRDLGCKWATETDAVIQGGLE